MEPLDMLRLDDLTRCGGANLRRRSGCRSRRWQRKHPDWALKVDQQDPTRPSRGPPDTRGRPCQPTIRRRKEVFELWLLLSNASNCRRKMDVSSDTNDDETDEQKVEKNGRTGGYTWKWATLSAQAPHVELMVGRKGSRQLVPSHGQREEL